MSDEGMTINCLGDINWEAVLDEMIEEANHIRVEGDFIVLDFVYEYSIHKDRRATPETILGWVVHLSEKNWMTARRLAQFTSLAFKDIRIETQR